jgi:hypothetical protein
MFQEWISWLPQHAGPRGPVVALGCAGVGLVLWVLGARLSRSIFTLVGVALGAWVGLRLPGWFGWEIDAMAIAIGGSLILGFAGYLLHTIWVGFMLGSLLAAAGTFIAWHPFFACKQPGAGAGWSVPTTIDWSGPTVTTLRELWQALPNTFARIVPYVASGSMAIGGLIAGFWPKLSRALAFSLLASALLVGGGVAWLMLARPQWLAYLPTDPQTQGIAMSILVVAGAVLQWALCPRTPQPQVSSGPKPVVDRWREQSARRRDVPDVVSKPRAPIKLKEARA